MFYTDNLIHLLLTDKLHCIPSVWAWSAPLHPTFLHPQIHLHSTAGQTAYKDRIIKIQIDMLVELHRWFLFIQTQKHFRLQRKFKAVSVNFHCSCFWRHLWTEAAWAPPSPVIKILSTFVLEMQHIFICFSFFLTQVDSRIMRYCNHVWLCKINYYYYQSVCLIDYFPIARIWVCLSVLCFPRVSWPLS